MSEHKARIQWERTTDDFVYDTFDRSHAWSFETGLTVPANWANHSEDRPNRIDPEIALAGALSSCHMLTFLALAAKKRLVVDRYEDDATAILEELEDGKHKGVTRIILKPRVRFGGEKEVSMESLHKMHDKAHEHCFIANSIRAEVVIEPEII